MQYKIKLADVPFFNFVNPSFARSLVKTFTVMKYKQGETILNYGDVIPGFYIMAEGEINIFARQTDILITKLENGSTFGEMSLLENETSSVTLKSASEQTVVLLCVREKFAELLATDFVFSAAFYKGAAINVSTRLRETNLKVEQEMEKGRTVLDGMMDKHGIIAKLGHTQGNLNDTGESMIAKLTNLLPIIEKLKKEGSNVEDLDTIKSSIKNVLTIDSQNFDIISQQMDQINQHLLNIQRLMSGLDMHEVKGDANIFEISKERSGDDEDAITFF